MRVEDSSCLSSSQICCVHTPPKNGYGSHLGSSVQVILIEHCYYTLLLLATTSSVAFEAYAGHPVCFFVMVPSDADGSKC